MAFRQSQANGNRFVSWVLILSFASMVVSACSGPSAGRAAPAAMLARADAGAQAKSTLSREHTVVVDIPEAQLGAGFQRVVSRCASDTAHHCTILQSDLSSGDAPSGLIKLRIDPEAVEDLIGLAAAQGRLERRATQIEDLADAIADTQAHIEMLTKLS